MSDNGFVGLVIVSHSAPLAQGLAELVGQLLRRAAKYVVPARGADIAGSPGAQSQAFCGG